MATTTEQPNQSSTNGFNPNEETLYDKYQKTIPQFSSEKKPSKGMFYEFVNCWKKARDDSASSKKDQKHGPAPATEPPLVDLDGNGTQNNIAEGSSSEKKKTPKTYEIPLEVRGFEQDERSLEIMLLKDGNNNSVKTIGVVGMPAVGKTTLCRLILENARVKKNYEPKIWVSLSLWVDVPQPPTTEIDEETRKQIGVPGDVTGLIRDEHELPGLLDDALNQKLKDKKYLMVLDDVCEEKEDRWFEKIKSGFIDKLPKEKGGAVIVTCRSEEKAKKIVGDENLHRLKPLSDLKSCWLIYSDAVKGSVTPENDIPNSKDVMEELMNKCGGLPGAAQMMGKIKNAQQQQQQQQRSTTRS
ncbi:hypothetical protein DITRI_Ditri04bG0082200 [Diplodiscus trichospermus]